MEAELNQSHRSRVDNRDTVKRTGRLLVVISAVLFIFSLMWVRSVEVYHYFTSDGKLAMLEAETDTLTQVNVYKRDSSGMWKITAAHQYTDNAHAWEGIRKLASDYLASTSPAGGVKLVRRNRRTWYEWWRWRDFLSHPRWQLPFDETVGRIDELPGHG